MIDRDGFRPNVGIILANAGAQVLWAKRAGQEAWQFPQGGIDRDETDEQAMLRELNEELGLDPAHVQILGVTRDWLRYRLPQRYIRRRRGRICVGQKQKWFALRLVGADSLIRFDLALRAEFDDWRWVDYWLPMEQVVDFKREVYRSALTELAPLIGAAPLAA